MEHTLSTEQVQPSERFNYWHDTVSELHTGVVCDSPCRHAFNGTLNWQELGDTTISKASARALNISHTVDHVNRADDEKFVALLQRTGTCQTEYGGQQYLLLPGELLLIDSSQPFHLFCLDNNDFERIAVSINKQALHNLIPNADLLTGVKIPQDAYFGALINDFCSQLTGVLHRVDQQTAPHIEATIIDLIAAGFTSVTDSSLLSMSKPNAASMIRIKAFVKSKLQDPALCREDIAEHVGLSVRQVNKLLGFEGTSSSRYIREQRLKKVYRNLNDPRFVNRTITDIAFDAGFENMQYFSRVFRKEFGVSPREYRFSSLRKN